METDSGSSDGNGDGNVRVVVSGSVCGNVNVVTTTTRGDNNTSTISANGDREEDDKLNDTAAN
jgi:hypothetical protein